MICVFFRLPLTGIQAATFTPLNGRAATAAAEITNTVEWITVQS